MTKFILVTGGVVSSVGKGIVVAAMGRMLKERGVSVSVQKLDPYINVDPGTMSPYQHGEVFVTDDGAETDLDLSYRAQLRGWEFVFVQDLVSPAEVPVEMNAFKSQQHRWAKGSIQTCRKNLPKILQSNLPLHVKVEAFFHLTANFNYLLMWLLFILLIRF